MNGILTSIIGALATGLVGLIGAIVMGKLVPASHVDRAEKEAEKWRTAYEEKRTAFDALDKVVERQQITAEVTNSVMNAVKQIVQAQLPPGGTS